VSYLDPPRLHFSGRFEAAISTVNNDPAHFDNATFESKFQTRQTGNDPSQWNGWFNPRGDADWRLIGCQVQSAANPDGSAVADDPILECLVADSDRLPPAKLVDLDSEQQLVSQIFGLEMRICDAGGTNNLVRGAFEPAPFMDIWTRAIGSGGDDNSAAAMYQSVLSGLEWGDVSASPFLTALRSAATDGLLSVKFNVDGVNLNWDSPEFLRGRIVGTIGLATQAEPVHFVRGRQFMATSSGAQGFPVPAGGVNNCVASFDNSTAVVHLDLGNALPTASAGGPLADIGTLSLAYVDPNLGNVVLGEIAYQPDTWYDATAGIVSLPVPANEAASVAADQLVILKSAPGGSVIAISEPATGLHVRADQFVYRLDPGGTATVKVYAQKFGQPYASARIKVIHDPYQLQPAPFNNAPPPGVPPGAIDFPDTIVADATGTASLPIFSRDPGNPRDFIDGQVYGVRPMLEETVAPGAVYPFNMWEFVSVLVYDAFVPDEPPSWFGSLQPIFQQYANLYPIMGDFVNLGDYDSVCDMREMMLLAFELEEANPNSMPVTRDLSTAKRTAILRWLRNPGPDGNPLKGPLPPPGATEPSPAPASEAPALAGAGEPPAGGPGPGQGGKAAAMARRLAFNPEARPQ
jgi:hypothetical protein